VPTSWNATWDAVTIESGSTGYRLPTEAQWEYAAKGGDDSPGNYIYAGSNTVGDVAWYSGNSGGTSHAVGTKNPNGLGIYDMSGNVYEWCWDWDERYSSGSFAMRRGGYWGDSAEDVRSALRDSIIPSSRGYFFGFRLVRP
jgi:formylglycine-generating enzyme required for sulfatase activity